MTRKTSMTELVLTLWCAEPTVLRPGARPRLDVRTELEWRWLAKGIPIDAELYHCVTR